MKVAYRQPSNGTITDLVIDSTDLKVFGEGEWKIRKHSAEKRRVWRKLHLAVDPATHDIVTAGGSLENAHDAEVLSTCGVSWDMSMWMVPMTAKPAIS
ncbi:hypothetical protein HNP12_003323 [Aeromonas hydrophila]|nr:hypothetical protein [Aeromonas hydrophila]